MNHARSNGVRRYRDFLPVCALVALGFLGGWYGFSKRGDVASHAIPEPARSFTGTHEVAKQEPGAIVPAADSPPSFEPPLSEDNAQRSAQLAVDGAAAAVAAAAMADGVNSK